MQAKQSRGNPVFSRLLRLRIAMTARVKTTDIPEEPKNSHGEPAPLRFFFESKSVTPNPNLKSKT